MSISAAGKGLELKDECGNNDAVDAEVLTVFVFGREAVVVGRPVVRPEIVALTSVSALKFEPGGLDAGSGEQGTLFGYELGDGLFVWTYSSLQSVTLAPPAGSTVPWRVASVWPTSRMFVCCVLMSGGCCRGRRSRLQLPGPCVEARTSRPLVAASASDSLRTPEPKLGMSWKDFLRPSLR